MQESPEDRLNHYRKVSEVLSNAGRSIVAAQAAALRCQEDASAKTHWALYKAGIDAWWDLSSVLFSESPLAFERLSEGFSKESKILYLEASL